MTNVNRWAGKRGKYQPLNNENRPVSKAQLIELDELRYKAKLEYILRGGCACGNCKFVRTQLAWIGAQAVRLELAEMSPGMKILVQADINFETDRMSRVIQEGCNVIK